jgi:hypothetical protein
LSLNKHISRPNLLQLLLLPPQLQQLFQSTISLHKLPLLLLLSKFNVNLTRNLAMKPLLEILSEETLQVIELASNLLVMIQLDLAPFLRQKQQQDDPFLKLELKRLRLQHLLKHQ